MKNFSLIAHQDSIELVYNEHNHITGVSYIPLDDGETIAKAHLEHHYVVFVLKGKVEISCKHYEKKSVSAGHMTFVSKGGFLQMTGHGSTSSLLIFGFNEITVRTNESLMNFLTVHGNQKAYIHNTLPINADMKQIVDRIVTQVRKGRIKNAAICQAWNIELFITFVTYYTKTEVTEFFRPLVCTDISFKDFVENNYAEAEWNAEQLITFSGLSRSMFLKKFKEEFGTTPKVWMTAKFKKELEFYASRPNMKTSYLASILRMSDVRLCQITQRLYRCSPQQLIESRKH
jgi:AraC-like DNA-binding protein